MKIVLSFFLSFFLSLSAYSIEDFDKMLFSNQQYMDNLKSVFKYKEFKLTKIRASHSYGFGIGWYGYEGYKVSKNFGIEGTIDCGDEAYEFKSNANFWGGTINIGYDPEFGSTIGFSINNQGQASVWSEPNGIKLYFRKITESKYIQISIPDFFVNAATYTVIGKNSNFKEIFDYYYESKTESEEQSEKSSNTSEEDFKSDHIVVQAYDSCAFVKELDKKF